MLRKKNHREMIARVDVADYLSDRTPLTWRCHGGANWHARSARTKTSYWVHGRTNELFRFTANGASLVSGTLEAMASAITRREKLHGKEKQHGKLEQMQVTEGVGP